MRAAPCYGCPDRRTGCHAACEKYRDWDTAHKEEREKRREQKARENNANSYVIELAAKKAKRTRKGHKQ